MSVPYEIPDRLRKVGVPVDPDSEEELAWAWADALEIIDELHGTKIAIPEVTVYSSEQWGLTPTEVDWSCEPLPGETASDFARRSRQEAREFIEEHHKNRLREWLYALDFTEQQDAA